MTRRNLGCNPLDHNIARRAFLAGSAAGAVGLLGSSSQAENLKRQQKRVLQIFLQGGVSQLESWDPKPNTQYGGPFRAISTALPGVNISELMPLMAQRMDQISLVRSMKTEDPNHSSGIGKILRGHPKNRGVVYPFLGSAVAKLLGPCQSGLPPYIWVKPGNGGFISKYAGFLGAKYGALALGDGKPPANMLRPETLTDGDDLARNRLRKLFNHRYAETHRKGNSEAHGYVYDVAHKLMQHSDLFDESRLPAADKERYGSHDLGRHMLLGRRLLEAGVRFVKVTSYGWDTHGDNFNSHASRMPKVDQALSALLDDLKDRGMLDNVLVLVMAEFGRTPRINGSVGRDHWPNAWSLAMAGSGIRPGVVVGKTNAEGSDVSTEPYDIGALFHTWFKALGIDPHKTEYMNGTQPLPIAHDDMSAISELLI